MMPSSISSGHSAQVTMRLFVNGSVLPVAQMGPDFLILDASIDHPPTDAMLALSVDGRERRWPVRLPGGLAKDSRTVVLARCE
jgi:hypothetical protein